MKRAKLVSILLSLALVLGLCPVGDTVSAATVKLNRKTVTVKKGKSITLKVRNAKKKAKWSVKTGKKYIRLKAKKKASVKVLGVKKGTARVQCKVGKKKLVCKVKVKDAGVNKTPTITPKVTVSPVISETPMVSQAPTASSEPTTSPIPTWVPCPTHEPTEDRLMEEPAKYKKLPSKDLEGNAIWYLNGNTRYYFFGTEILRENLDIRIMDTNVVSENATWSMDVSEKQNGSVMAWMADTDGDGIVEMNIGQQGGVVANPNSSYLFCDVKSVEGFENLFTTDVTDMSYMFMGCGRMDLEELDLGDHFDTGKVENVKYMFRYCGYWKLKKLRLGKYFNVSSITDKEKCFGMFDKGVPSAFYDYSCYVSCVEMKNWLLKEDDPLYLCTDNMKEVIVES